MVIYLHKKYYPPGSSDNDSRYFVRFVEFRIRKVNQALLLMLWGPL